MNILVINAGSSSFKYQLISWPTHELLCSGLVERIAETVGRLVYKVDEHKHIVEKHFADHAEAMNEVINLIINKNEGVIKSIKDITAIGHRVLLAGDELPGVVVVDEEVKKIIAKYIPLGPLHNKANLTGIEVCEELLSGVPNVAVFDTGFHQTMPEKAYLYAIDPKFHTEDKIRRYGFHGTSHSYVSKQALKYLNKEKSRLIICHLGNGCSISAVYDGQCVDTSMGLTPLEGLMMGTRSGDLDPAILIYLMETKGYSTQEMNDLLNKKSGLKAVSGYNDMRDLHAARARGEEMAELAFEMFCYRIKKYIGAYYAILGGLDALIFTAGIGENDAQTRAELCKDMKHLGISLDNEANELAIHTLREINSHESQAKVMIIPTNEELEIAFDTVQVLGLQLDTDSI